MYKCVKVWREFESCKRETDENVEEYMDRFEKYYEGVVLSIEIILEVIKAFMILRRANKTETEKAHFIKNRFLKEGRNVRTHV